MSCFVEENCFFMRLTVQGTDWIDQEESERLYRLR